MNTTTITPVSKELFPILQNLMRHSVRTSSPTLRFILMGKEELRLPASCAWTVRILSGNAWLSYAGEDFYPGGGEQFTIPLVKHGAILSAADHAPLVFEIRRLD